MLLPHYLDDYLSFKTVVGNGSLGSMVAKSVTGLE